MDAPLREQFIYGVMRLRRMDFAPADGCCLQQSELAVMARAWAGCACGEKGVSTSDIQQNLHISKPAVSQTLNSLERKGYITRRIDPDDRRRITVVLTPLGEAALVEARCSYGQTTDALLERFGRENTVALITLMNRLMDIMDA